ncbi:acyltransferase family protein [Rhizobium alvei]|uniref:Acyltransferase n=1 Tax=Rhizobium alvei TaxID=1132659 RepID=A0ABT8YJ99_9HYPH|nr:acyltransferase [Rhizobium alvei]MDO6963747.1 acyltransferase [Rhizobium alvei]
MEKAQSQPARFTALDGLRGLLCLLVVLAHFPGLTFIHGTAFHMSGDLFVDLFFVFSGFVIVAAFEAPLANGYGLRRFLIERLGRFYPIHVAVLALFVVTELAMAPFLSTYGQTGREAFTGTNTPEAIITNLLLIHSIGLHDTITWNYPAWSLSTEWFAYLYFGFAVVFGGRNFLPWAIGGAIVSASILIFLAPQHMHSNHDFGVFRSILGFSVGAIAFRVFSELRRRIDFTAVPTSAMTALEIAVFAAMILAQIAWATSPYGAFVLVFQFMVLVVFSIGGGQVSRFLSIKPLVYLGTISLSVYVIHAWILLRFINLASILERFTGIDLVRMEIVAGERMTFFNVSRLEGTFLAIVMIALIVAVSHFTYKYIEVPGQRPFRQFAKRIATLPVAMKKPA